MKAKKEIVVFKDRKSEADRDSNATGSSNESIDMQAFYAEIQKATSSQMLQTGLNKLCQILQAGQGALYLVTTKNEKRWVEMKSAYALPLGESETIEFELGEGLVGQVAASGKAMYLDELPEGYSNAILSGLGMAPPKYIFITPIWKDQKVIGVLEVATFSALTEALRKQATEMATKITEQV